jgi:hypothetical protein
MLWEIIYSRFWFEKKQGWMLAYYSQITWDEYDNTMIWHCSLKSSSFSVLISSKIATYVCYDNYYQWSFEIFLPLVHDHSLVVRHINRKKGTCERQMCGHFFEVLRSIHFSRVHFPFTNRNFHWRNTDNSLRKWK